MTEDEKLNYTKVAYSIAHSSLTKQIEAKYKQQLRTKCANKRFLLEEEKQDLQRIADSISNLRHELNLPTQKFKVGLALR